MENSHLYILIIIMIIVAYLGMRKIRRANAFLLRFGIIFMALIASVATQPVMDSESEIVELPIVLAGSMQPAADTIAGWLEQDVWSAPAWLNATVNLTANVTA